MRRIVIGVVAHVDSGKTSLSEAMLVEGGVLRRAGRVDHGSSFLDTEAVERERGITVFSSQAVFEYGGVGFTLLDTPGHVDFSPETERALRVLDAAILVVSGVDGVQSHTETLWRLLEYYHVPVFVFVNKMDISARTKEELFAELCGTLGEGFVDFSGEAASEHAPREAAEEIGSRTASTSGKGKETRAGVSGKDDETRAGVDGKDDETRAGVDGKDDENRAGTSGKDGENRAGMVSVGKGNSAGASGSDKETHVEAVGAGEKKSAGAVGSDKKTYVGAVSAGNRSRAAASGFEKKRRVEVDSAAEGAVSDVGSYDNGRNGSAKGRVDGAGKDSANGRVGGVGNNSADGRVGGNNSADGRVRGNNSAEGRAGGRDSSSSRADDVNGAADGFAGVRGNDLADGFENARGNGFADGKDVRENFPVSARNVRGIEAFGGEDAGEARISGEGAVGRAFSAGRSAFAEGLALCGDDLLEEFSEGKGFSVLSVRRAVGARRLFPVLFGSALRGSGVRALLSLICDAAPFPDFNGRRFGAKVFKITDEGGERLTHLKLTGGTLRVRDDVVTGSDGGSEISEKITRMRVFSGARAKNVNSVSAGEIAAVSGLTRTYAGQGLGVEQDAGAVKQEPVMSRKVILPEGTDVFTALGKFRRLGEEEPELRVSYDEREGCVRFGVMGEVQLEVLKRLIHDRFGMDVEFGEGGISYRETISAPALGIGHYEPLRHYAEVQVTLEPLPRGSGLEFACDCDERVLDLGFQRMVMGYLREYCPVGTLIGAPVTDMKITLVAGRASREHTEGGDFREAARRAVRQGLRTAGCTLLEPWYSLTFDVPSEALGKVMNDMERFGGKTEPPLLEGGSARLKARAPASALTDYRKELAAFTKGRGRMILEPDGLEICRDETPIIEAGYDPDRDVENPADSIFCAHGAGFVVKWDEVPEHRHVDCGVELESEDELQERAERFMKTAAGDDELRRIFERTYGDGSFQTTGFSPRRKLSEKRKKTASSSASEPSKRKAPVRKPGKEYLLVDGYNIIFAWDELRALAEKSLDLARRSLIDRVASYQCFRDCEAIIVFDAYKVKKNAGSFEKEGRLGIVYTREAQTADAYIEKAALELSREHRVRVATSDGAEQLIILGSGATRLPAAAFHAELIEVEGAIRAML